MFPNRDELRREIVELEGLIKNLEEKLGRGEILPEDRPKSEELLNIWKEQRNELNKAFDSDESRQYVGLYFDNGDESKVVLLVDTIERYAKGPYETMLLMGQVMLLEYFRSFYNHVGVGTRHSLSCAESSMAEFGSLMVLKSVASSGKQIAQTAKDSLNYSRSYIAKKQLCTGLIVANGFGAYLYDFHRKDFKSLIARYANVSCLLDNSCQEALEFKYMLYPKYPAPWNEDVAYKKLKALLNVDGVRLSRKDTNTAKRTFQIEHAVTTTSFYSVEAVSREEAESLFMEGKVKKEWEDKNENLDISKMEED